MNAQNPIKIVKNPRRVSKAMRAAIRSKVRTGIPWDEAAKMNGVSPSALYKARTKAHVLQIEEEEKTLFMMEVEQDALLAKQVAHTVGIDLMHNSKSDAVKARMVELFKGERKGNNVNVAVQVNNRGGSGYEFLPPGAQMVEITATTDDASVHQEGDDPVKQGHIVDSGNIASDPTSD